MGHFVEIPGSLHSSVGQTIDNNCQGASQASDHYAEIRSAQKERAITLTLPVHGDFQAEENLKKKSRKSYSTVGREEKIQKTHLGGRLYPILHSKREISCSLRHVTVQDDSSLRSKFSLDILVIWNRLDATSKLYFYLTRTLCYQSLPVIRRALLPSQLESDLQKFRHSRREKPSRRSIMVQVALKAWQSVMQKFRKSQLLLVRQAVCNSKRKLQKQAIVVQQASRFCSKLFIVRDQG